MNELIISKLPKCDNCKQPIKTFGKFVFINGVRGLYHMSFNEEIMLCGEI